jgi:exodeoxyribonuclease V gamma subunit
MREVEVLRDQLLAMFEEDRSLEPKDIIVMTPDIDKYSPYIQAVFDAPTDAALRIPFSIADRSARSESRLVEGFLALLDLKDSRLSAAQVLGLLDHPGIREKFNLTEEDIVSLESWIQGTEIRWGLDETSRAELGLPAFRENTWRSGLERLLLGYAMPGGERHLFADILPYDHIEGSDGRILGKFLRFFDDVVTCRKQLPDPKNLSQWHQTLNQILTVFFEASEEAAGDLQAIQQLLEQLAALETSSGFDQAIEFEAVRYWVRSRLDAPRFGSGFLSGGVTFCAMLPMRSIPFKIVCLIGMDHDAFPRDVQPLAFDLIDKYPKRGDRSRRDDDKYLFLEAILSARKILYISYLGQDIQDNSPNPPSVLVSELLDTIESDFHPADGAAIRDQIIVRDRLQPFSPAYFQGNERLFSYSKADLQAAMEAHVTQSPRPFISANLPLTVDHPDSWKTVDLEALCRFFNNPAKFMLQQCLGIFLEDKASVYEDTENLELTPLTRYMVEQNLFQARMEGWNLQDFHPIEKARGRLSHGSIGVAQYRSLSAGVDDFVTRISRFTRDKLNSPGEVDLQIGEFGLTGRLCDIYEQGQVHVRYANLRTKDVLRTWLYHLVLCETRIGKKPPTSLLIGRNSAWSFRPAAAGRTILQDLIGLFRRGLCEPLPFFPDSAWEYVSKRQKNPSDHDGAMDSARRKWVGNDFSAGESNDPYYRRCFGHTDPIDSTFAELAEQVLLRLVEHGTTVVI